MLRGTGAGPAAGWEAQEVAVMCAGAEPGATDSGTKTLGRH